MSDAVQPEHVNGGEQREAHTAYEHRDGVAIRVQSGQTSAPERQVAAQPPGTEDRGRKRANKEGDGHGRRVEMERHHQDERDQALDEHLRHLDYPERAKAAPAVQRTLEHGVDREDRERRRDHRDYQRRSGRQQMDAGRLQKDEAERERQAEAQVAEQRASKHRSGVPRL
jgi:hypothetical protein